MMNLAKFKKFFIFNLIGSLIISALVAVITVLVGDFNEVTGRVLLTLSMVVIHSLVSLAFIWDDEKQNTFEGLAFFVDVLFVLIVTSFFTSIFGIWKIIPSDLIWRLYQTYFIVGLASLHGDALSKALHKEKYMDLIIYGNFVFIAVIALLFQPIIFLNNSNEILGEMYFRILGAAGIVDGTLSVLTVIFYKLYTHKHPQANPKAPRKLSVWIWLFIIYLSLQLVIPLTSLVFSGILRGRPY